MGILTTTLFTLSSFGLQLPHGNPSPRSLGQFERPAFQLEDVHLENPVVSAGDRLQIHYTVSGDESQVCTLGGVSIYLGFFVQNIFVNSDALNRTSAALGAGNFEVTDLRISPYAVPTREYEIEQFSVYDCLGNYALLYDPGQSGFYYRNGELTQVPVMHFHLNENPNGDDVPPVVTKIVFDRESYAPGETPRIRIEAHDNLSGMSRISGAYFFLDPGAIGRAGMDTLTTSLGEGKYESKPFQIPTDLDPSIDSFLLSDFSVQDQAGIWGGLRLHSPDSPFYETYQGVPTAVPALRVKIDR